MSFEVGWELLLFLPNSVLFAIYLHQHSDILIFDVSMCSITSQSIIEENIEVEISDNVGVFSFYAEYFKSSFACESMLEDFSF